MEYNFFEILIGVGLGALALSLFLLWKSWFRIEEGHAAVLINHGAAKKDKNSKLIIYKAGVHTKAPWEQVVQFSTMERVLDLSGVEGGQHAMASDGTVLRLDSKIRFYPSKDHYYSYLFEMQNPMGHVKELFTCLLRNEIANFNSKYSTLEDFIGSYSQIRRERSRLNQEMEKNCNIQIGQKYGIKFSGMDLIDILPPPELEIALNAIQNAKSESETMYAKAEANSRQKIMAAKEAIDIAKVRAEANAIDIETQGSVVSKLLKIGQFHQYLQHRRTEILGSSRLTFMQKEF